MQAKTAKYDFSKGPVWQNIMRQAIPFTIAQFVQVLYNVVDRAYLGHLPGTNGLALTGVGLIFPIVTLIMGFCNLFSTGGTPLCSIARGSGDKNRAENIIGTTFSMLFLTGIVMTVVCYLFKKPILYLFGASDATFYYADAYLSVYLAGTMFVMLGSGMNGFINSQGFARTGMLTIVIGAALNVLLDPLFIFVFDMGVQGAAIATVISQGISCVWVLCFLTGKKAILHLKKSCLRPDPKLVREITALGLTGFIMAGTGCLVQVTCNLTLKLYGGDAYIGVMTVINSAREIFTIPINGLSSGSQPVLGYNYGAKEYRRVRSGIFFTTVVGIVLSLISWVLVLMFPHVLFQIFGDDPTLTAIGIPSLQIYFFGFCFMALQFAGQSTFMALGKSKQAIFFSLLRKAIIVFPLTLLLPKLFGLGVNGVFWAEPVSNLLGGAVCFTTMMCTVWRDLKKAEDTISGK